MAATLELCVNAVCVRVGAVALKLTRKRVGLARLFITVAGECPLPRKGEEEKSRCGLYIYTSRKTRSNYESFLFTHDMLQEVSNLVLRNYTLNVYTCI